MVRLLILLFLLITLNTQAQLCNGNLGDPIVNVNFGSGAAQSLGSVTNYIFQAADCPDDGKYSVRSNTSNCFDSWHTTGDHTGGGNMMVVNASFEPGIFYKDTVRNLCAGTTFEFSAWIMNLLQPGYCGGNGVKPNISFIIEDPGGNPLATYNTGDIQSATAVTWLQYGFYFTTPSDVSKVVLKMINNAEGGCGNDLAVDDITFRPCGPLISSAIVGETGDTARFCNSASKAYSLQATAGNSNYTNPGYQWQQYVNSNWMDIPGATGLQYSVSFPAGEPPGIFKYRLAMAEASNISSVLCRVQSAQLVIEVLGAPEVTASGAQTIFAGETTTISATLHNAGATHQWLNTSFISQPDSLVTQVNPPQDQYFIIEAISTLGCGSDKDSVFIRVLPGLFIPNAFTPNGDNLNDTWNIPALEAVGTFELNIYDRFGNIVFQTNKAGSGWNGTFKGNPVQTGAYVYILKYRGKTLKGSLLLLR